jgi:hypothetical protein
MVHIHIQHDQATYDEPDELSSTSMIIFLKTKLPHQCIQHVVQFLFSDPPQPQALTAILNVTESKQTEYLTRKPDYGPITYRSSCSYFFADILFLFLFCHVVYLFRIFFVQHMPMPCESSQQQLFTPPQLHNQAINGV